MFDFASWGSGEWGLLVTVVVALGIDGRSGWKGATWLGRKVRLLDPPPEPAPLPVVVVPETSKHPGFPPIRPPADHRKVVGREDDLIRLRTQLASGHNAQITSAGATIQGEGGRGKSTLARYYAEEMGGTYDGGAWIAAQSRAGIFEDLAAFGATAFDLSTPDPIPASHIKDILNRIATSPARLLFVFDNVDDYADVRDYLPKGEAVDIILTTRLTGGFEGFETIALDVLPFDSPDSPAVTLLLDAADQPLADAATRAEAQRLAETLGGMPLALVIAGALAKEGAGFAELATRLGEIIEAEPQNDSYPTSIAAAVQMSYDRLPEDARMLADVIAWWASEGITQNLFLDAPQGEWWFSVKDDIPDALANQITDAPRLRTAWRALCGLSFLQGEGADEMHRLTAAVLRHKQPEGGQPNARAAAALLGAVFPGGARNPQHSANWPACRLLTPHVRALWQAAEPLWSGPWSRSGWAAMDFLLGQSGVFFSSQENRPAELACKRASLHLTEARLGPEHLNIPLAKGNLALTLGQIGEFEEATTLLEEAVALDEEHRPGSEELAARYMQQADLQFNKTEAGDPSGLPLAEEVIERARVIRVGLGSDGAAGVAACWNHLGYLRRLQSRPLESAEALEQALTIRRGVPDIPSEHIATSAVNVGASYLEAGEAPRAEPLLREAYEEFAVIFAGSPGHSRPQIAADWLISCLLTLARMGDDPEGRRAEAQALCTRHGFDFSVMEADAQKFPLQPLTNS